MLDISSCSQFFLIIWVEFREVDYEDMPKAHHNSDTGGSHERKLRLDEDTATRHADYNTNRLHKKYSQESR